MISERIEIPNPFNNDEITVDIEYEVSFYEGLGYASAFDVEIKSLVTDEFVELVPSLSFEYLQDLKEKVMIQYKQNHQ